MMAPRPGGLPLSEMKQQFSLGFVRSDMTGVSASDAAYRELALSLNPAAVSQYLAATRPWQLEAKRDDISEIWSLPGDDGELRGRIMLPLATDYVDFPERFSDALRAIGIINGWSTAEVERHIMAARADMLLIHLHQFYAEDTIPLKQADVTLDAIYHMLKNAAITAAMPGRVQRGGRLPSVVSEFLDDNLRLGHTKRGSFVFTVVSRLDDAQDEMLAFSDDDTMEARFSRKVMATLARGLETTRDLALGKQSNALDAPARWGLSAGLIESLEAIAAPDGLRSLTLQFEWASAEPEPDVGREPIQLEHAAVAALSRVHELLVRAEEPAHKETLFGHVISLARDGDSLLEGEVGSVVISAEVNGRKRNVHMTLTGADHQYAIKAYQSKKPLIVTGDLVYERRAWHLTGDLAVDARLLERDRDSGKDLSG